MRRRPPTPDPGNVRSCGRPRIHKRGDCPMTDGGCRFAKSHGSAMVSRRGAGIEADIRDWLLVAATCLTSVSSDGQLTSASSMFELQRRLCDVKRAHAGVSAIPGHDPKRYLDSIETRPSRYPLRESKPELARRWNYPPGSQPALRKPSSQCWNTASSRTGIKERAACSEVKPGIRARNCSSASRASSNLPS